MDGYLSVILTAHMPYLRAFSRHPHGEEALHELTAFGIIPALNTLYDLRESGMEVPVGLAISPILIEQLADNIVQKHFATWMDGWLAQRADDLARWERQRGDHAAYLARFYLDWGRGILSSFNDRYRRNLAAALRGLCSGLAEPLAGAATHPYMPLVESPASIHAQLQIGLQTITRQLGRMPNGLWLPECAYHPACMPAISATDARYLIADPSSVAGEDLSHLRPRWAIPGRMQVLVRDIGAAELAWSPAIGYPGDPIYRAARRDPRSQIELWRNGIADDATELYDPYDAYRRADEHAEHFLKTVGSELMAFSKRHDRPGIVVVPLDLKLIGRSWFEGPIWLRAVFQHAMRGSGPALAAPSDYLRAFRSRQDAALAEGSWGAEGHAAWQSPAAAVIRRAIGEAEERLALLIADHPHADGPRERALNQALRELLLAQSSDWLLLAADQEVNTLGKAGRHLSRCEEMCRVAEGEIDAEQIELIGELEEKDNPFPDLSYRSFVRPG
jgi:1,4-alpha-glucan branching enzyme